MQQKNATPYTEIQLFWHTQSVNSINNFFRSVFPFTTHFCIQAEILKGEIIKVHWYVGPSIFSFINMTSKFDTV